jgi:hypothetical protein
MPRPKPISPKSGFFVRLPQDLVARVLSDLYSPVEECVPYGKWSQFIETCIREHFARMDAASKALLQPVQTTREGDTITHRHESFLGGSASHRVGLQCYECDKLLKDPSSA